MTCKVIADKNKPIKILDCETNNMFSLENKEEALKFCDALNVTLNYVNELIDAKVELKKENEQLKKDYKSLSHNHGLLYDESVEKIGSLKEQLIDCEQKKQAHKDMLMNSKPVTEQKRLQKIIYGMVIAMIDARIKAYEHRPFSAPVSNPVNPNYDSDVDRLARLSELQELKRELGGDVE